MAPAKSDGILLVDKPAGISSHDVVAVVRRARGGLRAGHTGTLDPFATGLLLVALGRATRIIRFVPAEPKVYRASIVFGTATDTDDATGQVVERGPLPAASAVHDAIRRLTGTIEQVPPAYSARHVEGRRAYAIARAGGDPVLAPATVTVSAWDVESLRDGELTSTITGSSGTYVRALARDLGRLCGTVAHLASLRRTRIGPFDVRDAVAPDAAANAPLIASADALISMTRRVVAGDDVVRVNHGRPVAANEEGTNAALVDESGDLVAVAERDGEWWQPRVVISGA
ncbi:MAG TPA: tRNA pseudouridine(55) synthase TruB [Gemmatimonadaceae bacterium]